MALLLCYQKIFIYILISFTFQNFPTVLYEDVFYSKYQNKEETRISILSKNR